MKAELNIDTKELVREITREVVKAVRPALQEKAADDNLYTVKTLAKYLEVSDQWVYERVHLKEIPHLKVGKFPRFRRRDIDSWLESLKIPVVSALSRPFKAVKR